MKSKIFYQGKLDVRKAIYPLIKEVREIAQTLNWQLVEVDTSWRMAPVVRMENCKLKGIRFVEESGLKGIVVHPGQDHSIPFVFDSEGQLINTFQVAMNDAHFQPWISATIPTHNPQTPVNVLGLFKYLKAKYIQNLQFRYHSDVAAISVTKNPSDTAYANVLKTIVEGSKPEEYENVDGMMEAILDQLDRLIKRFK